MSAEVKSEPASEQAETSFILQSLEGIENRVCSQRGRVKEAADILYGSQPPIANESPITEMPPAFFDAVKRRIRDINYHLDHLTEQTTRLNAGL